MTSGSVVTPNSVTITHNGTTYAADSSHVRFSEIREALKVRDYETAVGLISLVNTINDFGEGAIVVRNGSVYYGDELLSNECTQHIVDMIEDGFDAAPMLAFLENLMQNPSKRAVDELYRFILAANISITDDGYLLAYKKVKRNSDGDLVDIFSGKFTNNVGDFVEVPRNKVDENPNNTCSAGLHFCSQSYLPHYGSNGTDDVVVIVKINPADVVSIPVDYNNAKGRCCAYEVLQISPVNDHQEFFTTSVITEDELEEAVDDEYEAGHDIGYEDAINHTSSYDPSWSYAKKNGYTAGYIAAQ
jgi:hypothetical protein